MFNQPTSLSAMSSLPGRFAPSSDRPVPVLPLTGSRHGGRRRVPVVVLAALLAVVVAFTSGCGSGSGTEADLSRWSSEAAPHNGEWTLLTSESSAIDPWRRLRVSLDADRSTLTLVRTWTGAYGITSVDSVRIPIDGERHEISIPQWPDNRHIAVRPTADSVKYVSARWLDRGRTLQTSTRIPVLSSQGETDIRIHSEYRIAPDGERLVVLELRSTRPRPIHYVFGPAEAAS
jgi:hypothetical protein